MSRKHYFDDRIFYDVRFDRIWIGRPDHKIQGKPWQWWIVSKNDSGFNDLICEYSIPKHFVEIAREPEMSICGHYE